MNNQIYINWNQKKSQKYFQETMEPIFELWLLALQFCYLRWKLLNMYHDRSVSILSTELPKLKIN